MNRLERLSRALHLGRRFTPELLRHRGGLALVGLGSLATSALVLLRPWPIQWILDHALVPSLTDDPTGTDPGRIVLWGAAAALAIALLQAVAQYWRAVRLAEIGHDFTRQLRTRIFAHLSELAPSYHARHKSGDLLVRLMGDVPLVRSMVVDSAVELSHRLLLASGMVVLLLVIDPTLAGLVLLAGPLLLLSTRFLTGRLAIAVRKQRRKEGALADFLHEAIAGNDVIQSLGGTEHVVRRFKRNNRTSVRAGLKAARLAAGLSAAVEAQLGVALALAVGVGGWRALEGALTPGELIVFISYVRGLLKPVRGAARHAERIARGTAGAERVLSMLDAVPAVREHHDAVDAPRRPERLTLSGVGYRYPDGAQALEGVDLEFRRGRLVALVGRNGAGKSTLAMLLARLEDPDAGVIALDGTPLDRFRLTSLRDAVGLVLQQSLLFGESLRENLLLGAPEAEDEELRRALADAGAADLLARLPDGLDTVLGTAGKGLSGGQARRVCLARTLLADPGVLVVDEPFAGLDRASVDGVLDHLRALADDRIVIVIAHDLPELDDFDEVVWLERGRVAGIGPHDVLARDSVTYRSVLRPTSAEVGSERGSAR